jgi:3,4-dihydroxy 2-butanone 4-phosphate synthase / GTP cyclohydrolase II
MAGRTGFSTVAEAIAAIGRGEIVVVADDHDRENEGDFVMAAGKITPEAVNFMVTHGRGLVCMPLAPEICDNLGLRPMVASGADHQGTAFTISIDIADPPTTGISAQDRAHTIARAVTPDARPEDFTTPGHIFPLRAKGGGVLERTGHTEAAVDLARLAGLAPAGVVCEIMNADGSMARIGSLIRIAEAHGLCLITIADLVEYRMRHDLLVRRDAEARIPTPYGEFDAICYSSLVDDLEHMALILGRPGEGALVRVHSECLTGDVLGSLRCDCGAQLRESMRMIALEGEGVIVYVRGHEGRGIGLGHKLKAYELQDAGADTVEANEMLGFPADGRAYGTGAQILADLGVNNVRLLTNNPAKRAGLERHGIAVKERIALQTPPTPENLRYLQTKRDKLDHELLLDVFEMA